MQQKSRYKVLQNDDAELANIASWFCVQLITEKSHKHHKVHYTVEIKDIYRHQTCVFTETYRKIMASVTFLQWRRCQVKESPCQFTSLHVTTACQRKPKIGILPAYWWWLRGHDHMPGSTTASRLNATTFFMLAHHLVYPQFPCSRPGHTHHIQ